MKSMLTAAFSFLISQSVFAQLYPVLHDGDDLSIGNVVSIGSAWGLEYVDMVSLKGYRAKMAYSPGPAPNPQSEGTDRPGFIANGYFESSDCTGDPVMLPSWVRKGRVIIDPTLSNVYDAIQIAKNDIAGIDIYANGDLLEYLDESYYVPFGVEAAYFDAKSVRVTSDICWSLEPCNTEIWQQFISILVPDSGNHCPDITNPGELDVTHPRFPVEGFSLSSLKQNDPAVTGFQSIAYKRPKRIKWVDINTILKDGFEAQTK